ncbi:hypothetical protein GEV33_000345 [Tenebrio molitor]|uniref:FLYWCH-type domain-containing protein n=1 Tax=Tenebrio molitor TaxID=7067 RepID=A0A8J6HZF2_TENMO|nr:hypothetical protein GEV33_000345 [Tenebrio molitor]
MAIEENRKLLKLHNRNFLTFRSEVKLIFSEYHNVLQLFLITRGLKRSDSEEEITKTLVDIPTFSKTRRGKLCMIFKEHLFYKNQNIPGKTFWVCGNYYRSKCKARCVTDSTDPLQMPIVKIEKHSDDEDDSADNSTDSTIENKSSPQGCESMGDELFGTQLKTIRIQLKQTIEENRQLKKELMQKTLQLHYDVATGQVPAQALQGEICQVPIIGEKRVKEITLHQSRAMLPKRN